MLPYLLTYTPFFSHKTLVSTANMFIVLVCVNKKSCWHWSILIVLLLHWGEAGKSTSTTTATAASSTTTNTPTSTSSWVVCHLEQILSPFDHHYLCSDVSDMCLSYSEPELHSNCYQHRHFHRLPVAAAKQLLQHCMYLTKRYQYNPVEDSIYAAITYKIQCNIIRELWIC